MAGTGAQVSYKVLVVDDEPDLRQLVGIMLEKDPRLEVSASVGSVEEALTAARDTQPDVIILDHLLGGDVTGLEAAPLLKEAAPDTKIVMFSAVLNDSMEPQPAVDGIVNKLGLDLLPEMVTLVLGV